MVGGRIGGKGRAERDSSGDEVGHGHGRLAGVEAAQAPADEDRRSALSKVLDPGGEPLQCVFTNASAPAHAPSTNAITGVPQRPLKTERRPVGGDKTGDHHQRLAVSGPTLAQLPEPAEQTCSARGARPDEHTSELQSPIRTPY